MRKSWLRRAVVTTVAAVALSAATANPAAAHGHHLLRSYYMLVNTHTNQCMEVNSTAAESIVRQWPCWGGKNQRWVWHRFYEYDYQIESQYTHYCLSNRTGVGLVQLPCVSGMHQHWSQVSLGDGTGRYEIRDIYWTKCVEVQGASTVNGARIVLAPCTGAAHQLWRMVF